MSAAPAEASLDPASSYYHSPIVSQVRAFGWTMVAVTFVYVINNYLNVWLGFPGVYTLITGASESTGLSLLQTALYMLAVAGPVYFVIRSPERRLRADAMQMAGIANFIIRAAFWAVLLLGVVDALISFLRVEGLLQAVVGEEMTKNLGRSKFRGPYVHVPLIFVGILLATRTKTLGFQWLALLVVVAELFIVISRFVFSYEQAFQGDLVRFWYGALFLFASAYTLFEDGHVRVDVLYAGFSDRTKGFVNAWGCILLGYSMCWTIFVFAMWDKSSIVNTAILSYEVSQSGFGMYVKYWMAGFLAVFAVSMTIQFSSYLLESIADYRGDSGKRTAVVTGAH